MHSSVRPSFLGTICAISIWCKVSCLPFNFLSLSQSVYCQCSTEMGSVLYHRPHAHRPPPSPTLSMIAPENDTFNCNSVCKSLAINWKVFSFILKAQHSVTVVSLFCSCSFILVTLSVSFFVHFLNFSTKFFGGCCILSNLRVGGLYTSVNTSEVKS